ncbi:hypothetical protein [Actinoplanes sp. HUAS TT8]
MNTAQQKPAESAKPEPRKPVIRSVTHIVTKRRAVLDFFWS